MTPATRTKRGVSRGSTQSKQAALTNARRVGSLLILSSNARALTPEVEAKLRRAFVGTRVVEFDPAMDIEKIVSPTATVIVAGGDGTIGWVVRRLADSKRTLGIVSMGTFNNFAKSLHLPTTLDAAIRVIKIGKKRRITLGRLNGDVFLEAAVIGLFGEVIAAGESAKNRAFGAFADDLKHMVQARAFKYELTGDIRGNGTAMSLVFANTTSIGSQLPVSDTTPVDPYLEFSVHAGATRRDIVGRALSRAVLSKQREHGLGQVFKFRSLEVTTKPRVRIYADNVQLGRTPATITAELSSLRVILAK